MPEQIPDLIIVNNSYFLWKVGPMGGISKEGRMIPWGTLLLSEDEKYI